MIRSMTAFASRTGAMPGATWAWEMRSVNGRGLEMRLRLPEGLGDLEQVLRAALTDRLARGNVTLSLRLTRDEGDRLLAVDPAQLDHALQAMMLVQARAEALGLVLRDPAATEILSLRGVMTSAVPEGDDTAMIAALKDDIAPLLDDFVAMRATEGAALHGVLSEQLAAVETLVAEAATVAEARRDDARAALQAALARVMEAAPEMDEARVVQELALIAVKQDVTEELDRLRTHIAAARTLIADPKPAGRKLDFLMQEFNREANTLCSKSQASALTAVGLELKAVIEKLREQVQNVE